MVERLIPNQNAEGSSPSCPATFFMAFPGIPEPASVGIDEVPLKLQSLIRLSVSQVLPYPDSATSTISNYARLLLSANTQVNLTGAKDYSRLIKTHIIDCITAAQYIPVQKKIIDWGSGGGLPGLIWAAIFPDKEFHLCERIKKKAYFLEEARSLLELMHVNVHSCQGQELTKTISSDACIVARAVEPLPKIMTKLSSKNIPWKNLYLMAGPSWKELWEEYEKKQSNWKLKSQHCYSLEENLGDRFLLHFKKSK
jgi:16S rRNA (guanine(527)-N(7))-methyltransferase RsmG